jgi:UDP-glucuronate decarboxylase
MFYIQTDIDCICNNLLSDFSFDSKRKVLLAGASGFLGRYFVEVFRAINKRSKDTVFEVDAIDNGVSSGMYGKESIGGDGISYRSVDLIDGPLPDSKYDLIVHAAGIASPFYYRAKPIETLDVAVVGSRRLLDLANLNRAKYVFFSSSEIYGNPDNNNIPTKESYKGSVACLGPRACYDESKRLGETLAYIYHEYFGVDTSIIRPFNVYGPGMSELDYRVLPNFGSRIAKGESLDVYGNGLQTRTYCYVTDAVEGFFRVFFQGVPGEAYNIGNPKPEISVEELARLAVEISGSKAGFRVVDYPDTYPTDEPSRRCPDITKASFQIGYTPSVPLPVGLARFFEWTAKNYSV